MLEILEESMGETEKVRFIFQLIANSFPDKRIGFLKLFLETDTDLEHFKKLPFESSHVVSYSGSAVPIYESRINFYKSLLPLFNSPNLLEHKLGIEEHINGLRQTVEAEKKRDFIGHF
jgi:hypothetical protein